MQTLKKALNFSIKCIALSDFCYVRQTTMTNDSFTRCNFLFATAFLFYIRKCNVSMAVFTWCNSPCMWCIGGCNITYKWVSHPFCMIAMSNLIAVHKNCNHTTWTKPLNRKQNIFPKCCRIQKESHRVNEWIRAKFTPSESEHESKNCRWCLPFSLWSFSLVLWSFLLGFAWYE